VHVTGCTTAGARNFFDSGCVIGGRPQDLRFAGGPTRLRIGEDNVFREHVTVHCSNRMEEDTVIGSGNLLMAHCHVGHNCRLGDRIIVATGALMGGHVEVQDRAFISGNCLIHQFVRVGTLALMQGGSAISKDLPPFCIARGDNGICGLNVIGLRRAGFPPDERLELRRLYLALFRSGEGLRAAMTVASGWVRSDAGRTLLAFVAASRRGVVVEPGRASRGEPVEQE
jgi:UDP-N-acetylglucosamine acyltransferase